MAPMASHTAAAVWGSAWSGVQVASTSRPTSSGVRSAALRASVTASAASDAVVSVGRDPAPLGDARAAADPLVGGVEHRLEVGVGHDARSGAAEPEPGDGQAQHRSRSRDPQPGDGLALADPLAVVGEHAGEHAGERRGDRGGPAGADHRRPAASPPARSAPGRAGSISSSAATTKRPVTGASTMRSRTCRLPRVTACLDAELGDLGDELVERSDRRPRGSCAWPWP